MVKIVLVLIHNKSNQENSDQIEGLKSFLSLNSRINNTTDMDGHVTGSYKTYFYTLNALIEEHEVKIYQILPFGVIEPANINSLVSENVLYRLGDEDKVGDHPRFYNWALAKAVNNGFDIVSVIDDISTFDPTTLLNNESLLVQTDWGDVMDKGLQEIHEDKVEVFDESMTLAESIDSVAEIVSVIEEEADV